jgi:hypothetical protein
MRHHQTQDSEVWRRASVLALFATRQPGKHNRVRHGRASDTIIPRQATPCQLRQRRPLIDILRNGDGVLFGPNGPEHEAHLPSSALRSASVGGLQTRQQPSRGPCMPSATTGRQECSAMPVAMPSRMPGTTLARCSHANIQNTTRYSALAPDRFARFWQD